MEKFNLVVCGGTFEYLHEGHKAFLRFAFLKGKKVLLGLTSDEYVKSNGKGTISSYAERKNKLEAFLEKENVSGRVEIEPIDNAHIPRIWEKLPIEAIIVTEDSFKGAEAINKKRKEQGLPLLKIVVFPFVLASNGQVISSSKIRDKKVNVQSNFEALVLPDNLRPELKKPMGALITDFDNWIKTNSFTINPLQVITVGDVITKTFNELKFQQKISVIDFYVKREKKFSNIKELGFLGKEEIVEVENPAGYITNSLFGSVKKIMSLLKTSKRIILKIEGEEDLAVLPFLLFAPLGFTIFYGQPDKGVVKVDVAKNTRDTASYLISRFSPKNL
ncbi:MAG: pantetheine-phosphate adenylyltransferase [Candidatus Levybacteria bacterium]|nr:pantetheine-phosphate adenylyltransferase [Candidatus Levybacteria bacterium]